MARFARTSTARTEDLDAAAAVDAALARDAEALARQTEADADDRLPMLEPAPVLARRLATFGPLITLSLAVHLGLFALYALLNAPTPIPRQQETPVEIVQEVPKPDPKSAGQAALAPAPVPEKPKEEAKTAPEQPKVEQPKPAEPTPEPKPTQAAKAEASSSPAAPDQTEETAKAVQSLQQELAALKAEQEKLQAQSAAEAEPSKALGPLPDSFRAVAMPAASVTGDEVVSYQQEVFSQLAKAKKAGKHIVSPGVAHVVFNIDAQGNLLEVTLDHASGDPFLDGEAVAIVRRAAPFPPPPQGALRTFSASMHFVVED